MRQQSPLALPPPAGTAHWDREPLFSGRVIDALGSVNSAFVSLAVDLHAVRPGMPVLGLPAHVLAALARATPSGVGLSLPYALFDLRFRDERFWRFQAAAAHAVHDAQPGTAADSRLLRFMRGAVTLAWHLAQVDARVARLSLGLDGTTQEILAGLPVGSLDSVSRRAAPALAARFCSRERFWRLLSGALWLPPEPEGLERLKLLGLAMNGAEAARAQHLHRRLRRTTQA
jgi:hypothetical protein